MKQWLVGNVLGRALLNCRARRDLLAAALLRPETVGTVANDQLASTIITSLCASGKTFVDVGAHIGSIISMVRCNTPDVRVIAIEAVPEKAANLRRRFPAVEVHACACGESASEMSFFVDTRKSGYSSLCGPGQAGNDNVREITVPVRTLDETVPPDGVDAVKVDVEGAELGVLRGAIGVLRESRPTVMFESGPESNNALGYTKQALFEHLSSLGYAVLVPNRVAHNDSGLTLDGFLESHLYPRRTTNYFALPEERRTEVRDRSRRILGIAS